MSKVDALRAMREARYAAAQKAGAATRSAGTSTPKRAHPQPAASGDATTEPAAPEAAGDAGPVEELCGHRNMSGKTCRRPSGHAEKNHRYQ